MPSIINADNGIASGSVGLKYSSDNSGVLALQSNNNTIISASNTLTTISSTAVGIGTNNPEMRVDVNGGVRVQSITNPTSGSGMELAYDGTQGIIQAYSNRATLASVPVYLVTGQLRFPPTQNPSGDANTLDDYEEGTWTPSVGGTTTYTSRYGFYTKIGNIVTIQFRIHIAIFQNDSSRSTIYGLPFPMDGTSTREQTGGIGFWQNLYQSPAFLAMRGDPQQSYLIITGITSASASLSDGLGVMGNNANLYGYFTYRVY